MTENELLKKIALAKAKPDELTDISPKDLANLVLVVLQYAKEINKQILEGKIKGDKGADGADAYNPVPDLDYLSLPTAKAELKKFQKELTSKVLSDAQNALSKLRNGKDGKDAQVTKKQLEMAAKMACDLIELPDFRKYITEQPEAIRDSLELLQGDERLNVSAIDGLEELLKKHSGNKEMLVGGIRFLSQLADVRITSIANGDVLKWNSTTLQWENGAGGGAGLTDGDYGDITVGGTGTTMTIDNLAVTNAKVATGIDAVKIADGSISNTEFQYLNNVSSNIQTQLDGKAATLGADDNYVTDAEKVKLSNLSGTNTGDQSSVVGITGTKAQFDTAVTDGNFLYVGDITQYTDELSQDAVGGMVNSTLTYTDGTPELGINLSNANTWAADQSVPDEAYGAGWNGSTEVPTKNALYDKIETLGGGSGITRTVVTTSGSLTLGATASVDYTYYVAGAHTLSMPSPNTNRYTVKNLHSAAITIDTAGAENIEGAASLSLQPNDSVDIMSDSTNWYIH